MTDLPGRQPDPRLSYELGRTPDGALLSSWIRRVVAYLLDGIVVGAITCLLAWPWVSAYVGDLLDRLEDLSHGDRSDPSPFSGMFDSWHNLVIVGLIGIIVFSAYNGGFMRFNRGATPGKLALGIRVRLFAADGQLAWDAIGKRLAVQLVPSLGTVIPILGSALWIFGWVDGLWPLWDAKNQALHDKWPATCVVRSKAY